MRPPDGAPSSRAHWRRRARFRRGCMAYWRSDTPLFHRFDRGLDAGKGRQQDDGDLRLRRVHLLQHTQTIGVGQALLQRISTSPASTVLLTGESGTAVRRPQPALWACIRDYGKVARAASDLSNLTLRRHRIADDVDHVPHVEGFAEGAKRAGAYRFVEDFGGAVRGHEDDAPAWSSAPQRAKQSEIPRIG